MTKKLKREILQCEELFLALTQTDNSNELLHGKVKNIPNLGEDNMQSLDYSQISTIRNNAKNINLLTADFIKNTENDMKITPLIDHNDPSYKHYLNYNQAKEEMTKLRRTKIFRIGVIFLVSIVLIMILIYLIVFKTKGGDTINLDNPEDFDNNSISNVKVFMLNN